MFQPWFVELVSVLSNCAVALSAVFAATLAFIGINQWRTELKGKAKYELARKVVMLAFQFQDRFSLARDPFTYPGEWADRPHQENETQRLTAMLDESYARNKRLKPLLETTLELHTARWEVEIIFNREIGQLIQVLEDIYKDLQSAVWLHSEHRVASARGERSSEDVRETKRKVYGFPGDEFSQATNLAVENLVEKLKAHIR